MGKQLRSNPVLEKELIENMEKVTSLTKLAELYGISYVAMTSKLRRNNLMEFWLKRVKKIRPFVNQNISQKYARSYCVYFLDKPEEKFYGYTSKFRETHAYHITALKMNQHHNKLLQQLYNETENAEEEIVFELTKGFEIFANSPQEYQLKLPPTGFCT
jgi:L-rhamnose mutarotase